MQLKRILALITIAAALAGAADRWTLIGTAAKGERVFIDWHSLEYHAPPDSWEDWAAIWVKTTSGTSGKYTLAHFELNRPKRRFRVIAVIEYAADGDVLNSAQSSTGSWNEVVPDSIVEAVFNIVFPPGKEAK
jgi:hypothetical protein